MLFLIFHLGGLTIGLIAPRQFEEYAYALHSSIWLKLFELIIPSVKASQPIYTQKAAYKLLSLNTINTIWSFLACARSVFKK